jgi:3' terminal RNA ribose 2'-O-methyltransferase Hen1
MLLTITTTHSPAGDLGYLLAKNPARTQTFELAFGRAHVFYPEVSDERCTAALLLDVDPVGLVRGRGDAGPIAQYVNDRPYVASSFLSVAIAEVFGSALNGRSRERPALAQAAIPLEARIAALPARGGEAVVRRLFEPLGYTVEVAGHALDPRFAEWGESNVVGLALANTCRLSELLGHLYVLVPVLDAEKHYWFGADEVEKLLRRGEGWLATHPERELIAARYLKRRRLVRDALARLVDDEAADPDAAEDRHAAEEAAVERPISLHEQRLGAVAGVLKGSGARRVLDLGCGEGRLIQVLLRDRQFEHLLGMDVSYRALENAHDRLRLDRMPPAQRARVALMQGALTYRDDRLHGYDAAVAVEVIEHLDPARLEAFERVVFEFAHPQVVVVTTPNVEYNIRFETLPAGRFRHKDHRFEWTRAEFAGWAGGVAARHGYRARLLPVGLEDPAVGSPSQMAVFELLQPGQNDRATEDTEITE